MAFIGTLSEGLQADCWRVFKTGVYTLAPGETVATGQIFDRALTPVQGRNDTYPQFSKGDLIVLPSDPTAGFNHGVYTGPPITNSNSVPVAMPLGPIIYSGTAQVRVAALAGGTAVTVGSYIQESAAIGGSASVYGVAAAAYAIGQTLGIVLGYQIATSSAAAVAAGPQTVLMNSVAGITTATAITFDYQGPSGAFPQEIVTPTAVTQATFATATVTIAGTAAAGTTITITLGNVPGGPAVVTYTTTAADTTATIIAGKLTALINATTAVRGASPALSFVTNAAGVITLAAGAVGTGANATTLTALATGGTVTAVASSATLLGGTFPSITATFANAHGTGAIVLGQNTISGGVILAVPAAAGTANVGLVTVDIPSIT